MPPGEYADQDGRRFSFDRLGNATTLVAFVYTHCTDACPLLSATFQQAQRKLADEKLLGSRVMLVSLSVDPQHDSPSVLAEYGQQFKADAHVVAPPRQAAGGVAITTDLSALPAAVARTLRTVAPAPVTSNTCRPFAPRSIPGCPTRA